MLFSISKRINSYMGIPFKKIKVWSSQNTAFDHIFDHLQTRTTWKQCSQEHGLAPFLDTKAPKITRNYTKNLCRTLRDHKVVGSIPVASIKKNGRLCKKIAHKRPFFVYLYEKLTIFLKKFRLRGVFGGIK